MAKRLIESQLKDAVFMSQWIDASPIEWPTSDKIPHLCYAVLDLNDMVGDRDAALRQALAALEDVAGSECVRCSYASLNGSKCVYQMCDVCSAIAAIREVVGK